MVEFPKPPNPESSTEKDTDVHRQKVHIPVYEWPPKVEENKKKKQNYGATEKMG